MECLHIKNIKDTLYPFSVVNKTFHTAYACELNHKQIWNKCDVNYEMIMCLQKCFSGLVSSTRSSFSIFHLYHRTIIHPHSFILGKLHTKFDIIKPMYSFSLI